jgi:pantoate--beta-alanine ligase
MIIVKHIKDLKYFIQNRPVSKKRVGFVPTMGALHAGHISLIKKAKEETDLVVCSIFVNPTQFNNEADFDKYPITIEKDIDMLEAAGCDVLFLPHVEEMYPYNDEVVRYELGFIETVLEGEYRPGHFQGVCRIVHKLLQAVQPHFLFMGQKDYQQCMVVQKMIDLTAQPVQLVVCDAVREESGLAMSSRNMRLNEAEKIQALNIIKVLQYIQTHLKAGDVVELAQNARIQLEKEGFIVDYVAIADAQTLRNVDVWDGKQNIVALVAAYLNEVRLIDNIILR